MANPSLQIGNSNWAIKEDNLLGYSTAGTRFVPQPITMTRASAGTRVNSSGLVETVELLGSELVTNGDFATDSGWNKQPGWTISDGTANYDGSGNNYMSQNIGFSDGKTYKIKFDVTAISQGTINLYVNKPAFTLVKSATQTGSYEVFVTVTGGSQVIYFYSASNFIGSIDNVSIKESTKNNLARVDYDGTASSLLVEPERRNLVTYSEVISNLNFLTNGTGTNTITDNYTDSPEGVQNASRVQVSIVDTNDGANYRLIDLGSVMTNGVTREISFYAKSLTGLNQEVLVYWSYGKQIVTLTNDWQRFEISGTSTNSGAVLIGTRGGTTQYYAGGDANLDFALWGLQVEDDGSGGGSSYATSYIPTDGGTVTRVQDQYSKTGISNLINSEEGVLFLEMAALSNDGTYRLMNIRDVSNTDNFIYLGYKDASNTIRTRIEVGGVASTDMEFVLSNETEFNKIAIKWKTNDFALWVNGVEVATDSSGVSFTANTLDELSLDRNGSLEFNGKVKQLQVFKTALTDSELIALTT